MSQTATGFAQNQRSNKNNIISTRDAQDSEFLDQTGSINDGSGRIWIWTTKSTGYPDGSEYGYGGPLISSSPLAGEKLGMDRHSGTGLPTVNDCDAVQSILFPIKKKNVLDFLVQRLGRPY